MRILTHRILTAVLALVLLSSLAGVGGAATPASDDASLQIGGDVIEEGLPEDSGGGNDSGNGTGAPTGTNAGTTSEEGSNSGNESGGGQAEEPPEGVTAGEYYDDAQIEEWQTTADTELSIDLNVAEMEAQAAYETFVESGDEGASDGRTEQVGSDIGPSFDPAENAERLSEWLEGFLHDGMVFFIDEVFNNMLGTPTPENDGWEGILGQPVDETYSQLYEEVFIDKIMLPMFMFMSLAFTGYVLFIMPWAGITGQRVMPALLTMFGAVALVLFAWNFATLLHHVSDAMTMWFLPSGEELVRTEGLESDVDFSEDNHELRTGALAAAVGLKLAGWNIGLVLLVIHGVRQAILFFMPVLLGPILAGMYFGPRVSKAAFSIVFWQYIGLLVMNWPTALILSMAYHVNYTFGLGGEAGALANVAVMMGMFIIALGIPVIVNGSLLGGSLVAILMKGSVMNAGASKVRNHLPSTDGIKSRAKKGGGYINPTSRFKRTNSQSGERDQQRKAVAGRSNTPSGAPPMMRSSRRTATDGGYASGTRAVNYNSRTTVPSKGTVPSKSRHDAGSVDARRRERYRRLRSGGDN